MAAPSQAELVAQLKAVVDLAEELRDKAEEDAASIVGKIDALEQAYEGNNVGAVMSALSAVRASYSAAIGATRDLAAAHLEDWRGLITDSKSSAGDTIGLIADIYNYLHANSETFNSRNVTFGSPTAASGTGDGVMRRITADASDYPLEAVIAEVKTVTCVRDANSGTDKGREVFRFTGISRAEDNLLSDETSARVGSGIDTLITASHPDDSLVLNSGFDSRQGSDSAPTEITSWTSSISVVAPNFNFQTADIFRPAFNDNDTRRSLTVLNTATLTQKINLQALSLSPNGAYYAEIAWRRDSSTGTDGTGSIALHIGSKSDSVTITTQTGWQVLRVELGDDAWFANFNEEDLDIKLVVTVSTGDLLIDDLVFVPYSFVDGTGYVIVGGQTPFLAGGSLAPEGKKFTITDTTATAKISYWFARWFGAHMPTENTGSETITDP